MLLLRLCYGLYTIGYNLLKYLGRFNLVIILNFLILTLVGPIVIQYTSRHSLHAVIMCNARVIAIKWTKCLMTDARAVPNYCCKTQLKHFSLLAV